MLSKKSKYALKALVALARHGSKEPFMRIAEISEKEHIPKKFLEAILLTMRNNGILGSKLGVNGGYYLVTPPEEIKLTEVIRLTDGPIALVPCVSLNFYESCEDCEDEVTCGIKKVMLQVRDASLQVLSNTSIGDILQKELTALKSQKSKL